MKKDDIRTLIVITIICSLLALIVVLLNKKSNVDKMEIETDYNTFFSVNNCINDYISYVSKGNSDAINSILSSNYNDELNNISLSYPNNSSAVIDSVHEVKLNSRQIIYYATGRIVQSNYNKTDIIDGDFSVVVLIDYNNITYSIIPIYNNDYKKVINSIKKIDIIKNEYNSLKVSGLINKEQICVLYMNDYLDKINNNIDSAYNLLTIKMKEKYSSVNSYQNFINNNINEFSTIADKCYVSDGKNNTRIYYVKDANNNEFTFYEDGIMNYTVEYYLK